MLIDIQNTHEGSGFNKVCDFKISTNGIMIKALTSRLYSNPVASIVRELASNALDACPHTPMQITIPNYLDPQFTIRDFGPGLSRNQMVEVFCHFGESSKRSDNSQIGGFGLGAKSPFALVHSFTITSYNNGTETTYIASIAGDGIPTLNEISSKPTTETGLKICIPSSDGYKFREALTQIRFFKPRPIIDGEEISDPEIVYDDYLTMILSSKDNNKPGVLVGPVLYPLDTYKLGTTAQHPIILKYGIGEIEVTASREEIVYNRHTIDALKVDYENAIKVYRNQVTLILGRMTDPVEIVKFLNDNPFVSSYQRANINYTYTGILLKSSHGISYSTMKKKSGWSMLPYPDRLWDSSALVVVADQDLKGASKRIQQYVIANPIVPASIRGNPHVIIVPDDSEVTEANIPYVKLSDMPIIKSKRAIKYRTLSKRNKFVPATETANHYIKLDSDMKWCHLDIDHNMLCNLQEFYDFPIYVLPHDFKGKLKNLIDLTPIHMAAFAAWDAEKGEDAAACGADWSSYGVARYRNLIEILSTKGLLPPVPNLVFVPQIFQPLFTRPSTQWNTRLQQVLHNFPMLKHVEHHSGTTTSPCYSQLINLILKGI